MIGSLEENSFCLLKNTFFVIKDCLNIMKLNLSMKKFFLVENNSCFLLFVFGMKINYRILLNQVLLLFHKNF